MHSSKKTKTKYKRFREKKKISRIKDHDGARNFGVNKMRCRTHLRAEPNQEYEQDEYRD